MLPMTLLATINECPKYLLRGFPPYFILFLGMLFICFFFFHLLFSVAISDIVPNPDAPISPVPFRVSVMLPPICGKISDNQSISTNKAASPRLSNFITRSSIVNNVPMSQFSDQDGKVPPYRDVISSISEMFKQTVWNHRCSIEFPTNHPLRFSHASTWIQLHT